MERLAKISIIIAVLTWMTAAFNGVLSQETPEAEMIPEAGEYGEQYDADPELLLKAFGTTEGVPVVALAAIARAGLPVDEDMLELALTCWREAVCDTGTGGELTLAMADGFGDNVWREISHMELILQALTYPEIGRLMYTNAHYDTGGNFRHPQPDRPGC